MTNMSRRRAFKIADRQEESMAKSQYADRITFHLTVHPVGPLDVMSGLLAGAAPVTGRITRRAS